MSGLTIDDERLLNLIESATLDFYNIVQRYKHGEILFYRDLVTAADKVQRHISELRRRTYTFNTLPGVVIRKKSDQDEED